MQYRELTELKQKFADAAYLEQPDESINGRPSCHRLIRIYNDDTKGTIYEGYAGGVVTLTIDGQPIVENRIDWEVQLFTNKRVMEAVWVLLVAQCKADEIMKDADYYIEAALDGRISNGKGTWIQI